MEANFKIFLNEQLQDDEFRKEWEDIQPEMDVSLGNWSMQGYHKILLKKNFAERAGINQADISKLENGNEKSFS